MNRPPFTTADVRRINAAARKRDDSSLWPICGAFNATERAIRRLRDWQRAGGCFDDAESYAAALDAEVSRIVNSAN